MWGRCHAGNVGALPFWTWAQATESGEGIYSFSDSVMYDEAMRCAVQRGRHHFRVCKPTLPIFSESKSVDAVRTGLLQAKPHGLTLMLPASHLPTRTFDFDLYIVMRKVRKGWKGHSFSCVPPQICVLLSSWRQPQTSGHSPRICGSGDAGPLRRLRGARAAEPDTSLLHELRERLGDRIR